MEKTSINYRNLVFALIIVILFILLVFFVVKILDYKLAKISVEAEFKYANKAEFEKILTAKIGKRFWLLDLKSIQEEILQDIWLEDVSLKRSLSGVLFVKLKERKLFARWNADNLLDTNLNILPQNANAPYDLLVLNVDSEDLKLAGNLAKKINIMFNSYGIKLTNASMTNSGLWELTIENAIKLQLGKKDLDTKLNKFFFVWKTYLAKEADTIQSLDLRYPNGLTINKKGQ